MVGDKLPDMQKVPCLIPGVSSGKDAEGAEKGHMRAHCWKAYATLFCPDGQESSTDSHFGHFCRVR